MTQPASWFENLQNFFKPDSIQYYILVIAVGFILYKTVKAILHAVINQIGKRLDHKALYWRFMEKTIDFVLLFVLLFEVSSRLPFIGNLPGSLLAGSTVLIAAVGFAAQEPMANLISGMFLSFFKPFAAGDRVKLLSVGIIGWIEDITLRHTVIRTVENNRVIVPNSVMGREVVENSNFQDERILNFLDVKITYESDAARAKEIMLEEVLSHPDFTDWRSEQEKEEGVPQASVLIRDIVNNCVELRVGVWTKDIGVSFNVCSDLRLNIMRRFKDEGITLYYQTVRVADGQ